MEKNIREFDGKEYFAACYSKDLHEGAQKRIEYDFDHEFALFRVQGIIFCIDNECPHHHQRKLNKGFRKGLEISCPLHGWTYDLRTGENVDKGKNIGIFLTKELDGIIYIEKPDDNLPKWMQNF